MLGQILRDIFAASRTRKPADTPGAGPSDNPLVDYFYNNPGHGICKWHHYFEIYHRHFARYRGASPVVLEIGVAMGGSLAMWHRYFGPGTRVIGVDVDPACRQFAKEGTEVLIGDQADRKFLATIRERVPRIDVLIDDGGHIMAQQIATFEELYPHVHADGIYLCEDTHTSLKPEWGGGYRREGTFLELTKSMVDRLSAWHSNDAALVVGEFTRSTFAVHFYDSVVVFEKRAMTKPRQFLTEGVGVAKGQPVRFKP